MRIDRDICGYLDESWACSFHLANEKAVPPDGAPPVTAILFLWFSDKEHGTRYDYRDEENKEAYESGCSE